MPPPQPARKASAGDQKSQTEPDQFGPLKSFSQTPSSKPATNNLRTVPLLSTRADGPASVNPPPGTSLQFVPLTLR